MDAIKDFLKHLTQEPGVYRMISQTGQIIYVGKAKNLKRRVSSYFNRQHADEKTRTMVPQIVSIEVTVTPSEAEALILENTLIKKHKPKYNIIFKDDKSYPYIYISSQKAFPQLLTYRGTAKKEGESFGPYPTMASTKETVKLLQSIFPLRDCTDHFFNNRLRPCLQHQIQRCSAPCVGYVEEAEYAENVKMARLFLQGRNEKVLQKVAEKMQKASDEQAYELAARFRDQLQKLQRLQEQQGVYTTQRVDADIIAVARQGIDVCVSVLYVRQGQVLGNKTYFPKVHFEVMDEELAQTFVQQLYLASTQLRPLDELICAFDLAISEDDKKLISNRKLKVVQRPRTERLQWLKMAKLNADEALRSKLAKSRDWASYYEQIQVLLGLPKTPTRMECVDISHTQGESTVASCVVFGASGALKADYRRFNIRGVQASDDYAAIHQVVMRRLNRLKTEDKTLPDLFIIDGGKGQLKKAQEALLELAIEDVTLLAISKGPARKVGMENLWLVGKALPIKLPPDHPAFHALQQIRDEAHRFAITGHRQQRDKKLKVSGLEEVPGVGAKRRRALLNHFGSLDAVRKASETEICKVAGVSEALAKIIKKSL